MEHLVDCQETKKFHTRTRTQRVTSQITAMSRQGVEGKIIVLQPLSKDNAIVSIHIHRYCDR
jgi:hypothetical protein